MKSTYSAYSTYSSHSTYSTYSTSLRTLRLVTSGLAASSHPHPNPNPNPNPNPSPTIRTGDVFEHAIVKNAAPFGLFVDVGVGIYVHAAATGFGHSPFSFPYAPPAPG